MKKVLIGLGIVVVLVIGGCVGLVIYGFSQIDDLVEMLIETEGSKAIGSAIEVESVEIELTSGKASIYGFTVANPEGFSDATMLSFSELSVSFDLVGLAESSGEVIAIDSIIARDPYVLFESGEELSNLETVSAMFESDEAPTEPDPQAAAMPNLAISSVLIENIQGSLEHEFLPDPLNVSLGDITLENLEGTPQEISSQIMKPILSQLTKSATDALLSSLADIDLGAVEDIARERVNEELEQLEETATNAIEDALGEDAIEGLRGLLR